MDTRLNRDEVLRRVQESTLAARVQARRSAALIRASRMLLARYARENLRGEILNAFRAREQTHHR